MKMKDIRKQIKQELAPFMKERGFRKGEQGQAYIRKFGGGFHKFVVAIFNYSPLYKLSCGGMIRLDAVEALVQIAFPADIGTEGSTAGININYRLIDTPDNQFIAFMEPDELHAALEHVKAQFDTKYVPIFDRCVDVKGAFDCVCSLPEFNALASPHGWARDLTLSALNRSPLFEQWAERFLSGTIDADYKQKFSSLVETLRPIATGETAN